MATTTQYWTNDDALLYQAYGTTVDWTWDYGDGRFFWSFCVRPLRRVADVFVTVERVTAVEDIRTVDAKRKTLVPIRAKKSPKAASRRRSS